MDKAKTVDNLGPRAHERFIENAKLLSDEELQKVIQTPTVAKRTETLTTTPIYPELIKLWQLQNNAAWPFEKPPFFETASSNLFSNQLVPNLGPLDEFIEKLESEKSSDPEIEKQRNQLIDFATRMKRLNKVLEDIKKKQDEYHKG